MTERRTRPARPVSAPGPLWLSGKNPMARVLMSIVIFEAIVFGLAIPVMTQVSNVPAATAGLACGGAALLALLSAGLLRRPIGTIIGWVTQVAGLALGVLTPGMYVVAAIFVALWLITFVLGRRLDANAASTATH